jgi:hypothetical protein
VIAEALHGDDGPENLPLHDLRILGDAGHERGLDEETCSTPAVTSGQKLYAGLLFRPVQETRDPLPVVRGDKRAYLHVSPLAESAVLMVEIAPESWWARPS